MKSKLSDYHKIRKIGSGSFADIFEVEIIENGVPKIYAMKQIEQKKILKLNKMHQPFIQKQVLRKFTTIYPQGFVNLIETHIDNENIYIILQICEGSSLQKIIPQLKSIPNKDEVVKRIIAKLVLILETMHKQGVVHRDFKPANILFKKNGLLKLADFGTASAPNTFYQSGAAQQIASLKQMANKKKSEKMSEEDNQVESLSGERRATFVGTPLYMAPELISEDQCGPQADLWALGCIIYQLVNSKSPFADENQGIVWKKILDENYTSKLSVTKKNQTEWEYQCEFLTSALLVRDKQKRLGFGVTGYEQLKSHSFFKGVNWEKIKVQPIEELADLFEEEQMLKSVESTQSKQSEEEKILLSGKVNKKMFFGNFKERMLVLNSTPKLIYYDIETGEKKGEIPLLKDTPIETQGHKIFTVSNEKKTYYFKSGNAQQWIEMMKYAIVNAYY